MNEQTNIHTAIRHKALIIVRRLTMFVDVKSFFLYPLVNTQSYRGIHHLKQDVSDNRTEHDGDKCGKHLHPQLMPVAIKRTLHTAFARDKPCGKHTGQYRTDNTTYTMHAKGIQRVVNFQLFL